METSRNQKEFSHRFVPELECENDMQTSKAGIQNAYNEVLCGQYSAVVSMKRRLAFLIVLSLSVTLPLYASAPIPDSAYEEAILYQGNHSVVLRAKNNQPIEVGSQPAFFLLVSEGTGYLADFGSSPTIGSEGFPEGSGAWNIGASLNKHVSWTRLTREKSQELWGEPVERTVRPRLTSFDVFGKCNEETNLYHVDVNFDRDGNARSYRIRGIGISKAKWIRYRTEEGFDTFS